jgi:phosphoribosylamine--glycine ligase
MKILVVGGGGREHALVWRLAQNPTVDRIYAAPGNAGIAREATCLPIAAGDVGAIVEFVEQQAVDLTIVGPEAPLVAGLADELEARHLPVFGPTAKAARVEGSKSWAKAICERHGIKTPRSSTFTDAGDAEVFLDEMNAPFVVKADGLAAGKGVTVTDDRAEAVASLRAILLDRVFGDAGSKVLIEEYVEGREISALCITDGKRVVPLALAQDHKRVGEGDTGPNTGGMGAYSPLPFVDDGLEKQIHWDVLTQAVRALEAEGIRYRGVLYAGLMLTDDGPTLLEFNCRFGDPETQAIVPRLASDLGELLLACVEGNLGNYRVNWRPESCITVTLASAGYPGEVESGLPIEGLEAAGEVDGVTVFHSGTAMRDGKVVTTGGRVLSVSALGASLNEARERAYEATSRISFEGMQYRNDIAANAAQGGGA